MTEPAKTQDGRVVIQTKEGTIGSVAPDKLKEIVDSGLGRPISQSDYDAVLKRRETEGFGSAFETAGRFMAEGAAGAYQDTQGAISRLPAWAALGMGPLATPFLAAKAEAELGKKAGVDITDRSRGIPQQIVGAAGGNEQAYAERTQALGERHPLLAGTGELIGQSAALAGTGLASTAAATAESAAARAGLGKVATGIAVGAAGAGVEGAAQGMMTAEDAARLRGDPGATASALAAGGIVGLGLGAGLGGALGGTTGLARKLWGRAAEGEATRVAEAAAAREAAPPPAAGSLADDMSRLASEAAPEPTGIAKAIEEANVALGADRQTVREIGAMNRSPEARASRDVIRNAQELKAQTVDAITETARSIERGLSIVRRHTGRAAKLEEIAGDVPSATLGKARQRMAEFSTQAEALKSRLVDEFGPKNARRAMGVVDDLLDATRRRMAKAQTGEQAFVAIDTVKKDMGNRVSAELKQLAGQKLKGEQRRAVEAALDWMNPNVDGTGYTLLQGFLEDPAMVGEIASARQVGMNRPIAEMLGKRHNDRYSEAMFTAESRPSWEPGEQNFRVDVQKVSAAVDRIGRFQSDDVISALSERTELAKNTIDAMLTHGRGLPESEIKALTKARDDTIRQVDILKQRFKDVATINKAESLRKAEEMGTKGAGILPLMGPAGGAAVGGMVGGVPGAVIGGGLGLAMNMVTKPYTAAMVSDPIADAITKVLGSFGRRAGRIAKPSAAMRAGRKAIESAGKAASKMGEQAVRYGRGSSMQLFMGGHDDPVKAYHTRTEQVIRASQQGTIVDDISREIPLFSAQHPEEAGMTAMRAQQAADYLISKMPAISWVPNVFSKNQFPPISKAEAIRWGKIWSAVVDPRTVLVDAEKGHVSQDQVDALKMVYPEVYQELRSGVVRELLNAAGTERYTLAERRVLDSLFHIGDAAGTGMSLAISEMVANAYKMVGARAQQKPQMPQAQQSTAKAYAPEQPWNKVK